MKRLGLLLVVGALVGFSPSWLHAQGEEATQVASPPGSQLSDTPTLDSVLRPLLAERLGVMEQQVTIEFGRVSAGRAIDPTRPIVIKGSGSGGVFVLDAMDLDGDRMGVQIKAGVRTHEAVAAHTLTRGHLVEEHDVRLVEVVRFGNTARSDASVVGWEVARTIAPGDPLREPAIRRPPVVRSGESVEVQWANAKVMLSLAGTALSTGAVGETITVRLGTGRRVRGVAQPDGTIRLEGGTK